MSDISKYLQLVLQSDTTQSTVLPSNYAILKLAVHIPLPAASHAWATKFENEPTPLDGLLKRYLWEVTNMTK